MMSSSSNNKPSPPEISMGPDDSDSDNQNLHDMSDEILDPRLHGGGASPSRLPVYTSVGCLLFLILLIAIMAGSGDDDNDAKKNGRASGSGLGTPQMPSTPSPTPASVRLNNGDDAGGGADDDAGDEVIDDFDDEEPPYLPPEMTTVWTPPPDNLAALCANVSTFELRDACSFACLPGECCKHPTNFDSYLSCLQNHTEECHTYHTACAILEYENDEPAAPAPDISNLPPAPEGLEIVCSGESLAYIPAQHECHEMCQPAACCYDDFDQAADSCVNDPNCIQYAACHNLKATTRDHANIASFVNTVCAPDKIQSGGTAATEVCKTACEQAVCCYDPYVPCLAQTLGNANFCDQYAACNAVMSHENDPPSTEAMNVTVSCGLDTLNTHEDYEACKVACLDHYECCRNPLDSPDPSCGGVDCNDYAACVHGYNNSTHPWIPQLGGITPPETIADILKSQFVPPPANLSDICNDVSTPERRQDCAAACAPGECCKHPTSMNPYISCLQNHAPECHVYHIECAILEYDNLDQAPPPPPATPEESTVPDAPEGLDVVCASESMAYIPAQHECQELCQPAACCFEDFEQASDSCVNDPQCSQYASCHHLKASKSQHEDIQGLVNTVCAEDMLNRDPAAAQVCATVCGQAACCLDPNVPCLAEQEQDEQPGNEDFCSQYLACNILVDNADIEGSTTKSPQAEAVASACGNITSEELFDACQEECDGIYECCRTTGGGAVPEGEPEPCGVENCNDYAACVHAYEKMWTGGIPGGFRP